MEARAGYKTRTDYKPLPAVLCEKCGRQLGYEVSMEWQHSRRGKIASKIFVRTVFGKAVAKLFVRGEVICECGEKAVWGG